MRLTREEKEVVQKIIRSTPHYVDPEEQEHDEEILGYAFSQPGGSGAGGGAAATPTITGITWDFDSHIQNYTSSDNFPLTWHSDGAQYTSWGDGPGLDASGNVSMGVAKFTGTPESHGGSELAENPAGLTGKCKGILAVPNGDLYLFRRPDGPQWFRQTNLLKSTDNGVNWSSVVVWTNAGGGGTDSVGDPCFMQAGQGYGLWTADAYVYGYYCGVVDDANLDGKVYVMRAQYGSSALDTKANWEYWNGTGWTANDPTAAAAIIDESSNGLEDGISAIWLPRYQKILFCCNHLRGVAEFNKSNFAFYLQDTPGQSATLLHRYNSSTDPWGPSSPVDFNNQFFLCLSPKWSDAAQGSGHGPAFVAQFTGVNLGGSNFDSMNTIEGAFTEA